MNQYFIDTMDLGEADVYVTLIEKKITKYCMSVKDACEEIGIEPYLYRISKVFFENKIPEETFYGLFTRPFRFTQLYNTVEFAQLIYDKKMDLIEYGDFCEATVYVKLVEKKIMKHKITVEEACEQIDIKPFLYRASKFFIEHKAKLFDRDSINNNSISNNNNSISDLEAAKDSHRASSS